MSPGFAQRLAGVSLSADVTGIFKPTCQLSARLGVVFRDKDSGRHDVKGIGRYQGALNVRALESSGALRKASEPDSQGWAVPECAYSFRLATTRSGWEVTWHAAGSTLFRRASA